MVWILHYFAGCQGFKEEVGVGIVLADHRLTRPEVGGIILIKSLFMSELSIFSSAPPEVDI